MVIIKTKELTRVYPRVKALDNLTVSIPQGAVGLLGPNGAGKTTLLKILLGLIPLTSGEVSIFGLDVKQYFLRIRQMIGYMPEDENFIPEVNAVDYVYLAGRLVGMPHIDAMQRAHMVLYYVGLQEERYREIDTLSAGMKQKVKFAQAIVHHPKLLLLDEPTTGLDPSGREEMLSLIRDVSHNRGINVLLSTHILHDVEQVCDYVIMLNNGIAIAQCEIESLLCEKENTYDLFIKGENQIFCRKLEEEGISYKRSPNGTITVTISDENKPVSRKIFEIALKTRSQIRRFVPSKSELEEVFSKLYKPA